MKLCPACGHEWHLGQNRCGVLCSSGADCHPCTCDDSKAAKADTGKPAGFAMIPFDAIAELADVYTYGAEKYQRDSWRNVPGAVDRYYDALQRHLGAWTKGEERDPESGRRHLAHALWNVVAVLELTRKP
jgi:hypothetical protein